MGVLAALDQRIATRYHIKAMDLGTAATSSINVAANMCQAWKAASCSRLAIVSFW